MTGIDPSFADDALALAQHLAAGVPLDEAFAKTFHQETTMHVADLNGTHLGKTITVTTKHETITGVLWDVTHEASRITDERLCVDPRTTPDVGGRIVHRLTIGAVDGSLPGDADVKVHP